MEHGSHRGPLHNAIRWGLSDVAEILISAGADVNHEAHFVAHPTRGTPLLMAAWRGEEGVAKLLLDAGADVEGNYRNPGTQTYLYCQNFGTCATSLLALLPSIY